MDCSSCNAALLYRSSLNRPKSRTRLYLNQFGTTMSLLDWDASSEGIGIEDTARHGRTRCTPAEAALSFICNAERGSLFVPREELRRPCRSRAPSTRSSTRTRSASATRCRSSESHKAERDTSDGRHQHGTRLYINSEETADFRIPPLRARLWNHLARLRIRYTDGVIKAQLSGLAVESRSGSKDVCLRSGFFREWKTSAHLFSGMTHKESNTAINKGNSHNDQVEKYFFVLIKCARSALCHPRARSRLPSKSHLPVRYKNCDWKKAI